MLAPTGHEADVFRRSLDKPDRHAGVEVHGHKLRVHRLGLVLHVEDAERLVDRRHRQWHPLLTGKLARGGRNRIAVRVMGGMPQLG